MQMVAARIGAPLMNDFCTVSLSDRLTPWPKIEERLRAAAIGDFVVAIYNPSSKDRDWQLKQAIDLFKEYRSKTTTVVLARQVGRPEEEINYDEVWDAITAAQLYETITDMPHGLYTCIGENGVNFSGGQRQRLALARAFYRKTKFLILDEATSSLDEKTEADVINSLEIIGRRCTTVVIAHRLKTLSKCDKIYEIKDGLVASSGTYSDLCDPKHPLGMSVKDSKNVEE